MDGINRAEEVEVDVEVEVEVLYLGLVHAVSTNIRIRSMNKK